MGKPNFNDIKVLKQISKNGIFYWTNGSIYDCKPNVDLANKCLVYSWDYLDMCGRDTGSLTFYFKDYGKKRNGGWALTKEELEDTKPVEEPIISTILKTDNPEKILIKTIKLGSKKEISLKDGVYIKKDYTSNESALFNIIEALMAKYESKDKE